MLGAKSLYMLETLKKVPGMIYAIFHAFVRQVSYIFFCFILFLSVRTLFIKGILPYLSYFHLVKVKEFKYNMDIHMVTF